MTMSRPAAFLKVTLPVPFVARNFRKLSSVSSNSAKQPAGWQRAKGAEIPGSVIAVWTLMLPAIDTLTGTWTVNLCSESFPARAIETRENGMFLPWIRMTCSMSQNICGGGPACMRH